MLSKMVCEGAERGCRVELLPGAVRVGILAIVRTQLGALAINCGDESASGAKVAAGRAEKRRSSALGNHPL